MAACDNGLTVLDPSCDALRKKGGFDKRFWIGSVNDLASVTYGTDQEVTAFTFNATKGFKTFTGKKLKHGATHGIEVGENNTSRTQNFNAVLYARSGAERAALENLIDAEDVFVVAEGNHGLLEVYGINKGANSQFDNYGLKVTTAEKNDGALLNDDTSAKLTFSGEFENWNLVYAEGETLADSIAVIVGQVV